MRKKVTALAALCRVAISYARACRDGNVPKAELMLALQSLANAGLSNILLLCMLA